jgi:hypothetical protein
VHKRVGGGGGKSAGRVRLQGGVPLGSAPSSCASDRWAGRFGLGARLLFCPTAGAQVDQDPGLVGNLLVKRLTGAECHLVSKEEYARTGGLALGQQLAAQLSKERGANPYIIPVGGSSPLGTWGESWLGVGGAVEVDGFQAALWPHWLGRAC